MGLVLFGGGALAGALVNFGWGQVQVAKSQREADLAIARAAVRATEVTRLTGLLDRYVARFGPLEVTDDVR